MKSTGVVRKIDELGRIVIPKEIRKVMDIDERDPLEIFTDEDKIIFKKYEPCCLFCGNSENVVYFNNKKICSECLEKIKTQF